MPQQDNQHQHHQQQGHGHHHDHGHEHTHGFNFGHYLPLQQYYDLVEQALTNFGLEPEKARGEEKGSWLLQKDGNPIWIDVFQKPQEPWGYFQCLSPAFELPGDEQVRCKIYQALLEKAHTIFGVAITKYKNWIYVRVIRELTNITVEEIMNIIARVGTFALELKKEFGQVGKN